VNAGRTDRKEQVLCTTHGKIMNTFFTVILSAALLSIAVQAQASVGTGSAEFRPFETPRLLAGPKTKTAEPRTPRLCATSSQLVAAARGGCPSGDTQAVDSTA
jgi:hypothetical protein